MATRKNTTKTKRAPAPRPKRRAQKMTAAEQREHEAFEAASRRTQELTLEEVGRRTRTALEAAGLMIPGVLGLVVCNLSACTVTPGLGSMKATIALATLERLGFVTLAEGQRDNAIGVLAALHDNGAGADKPPPSGAVGKVVRITCNSPHCPSEMTLRAGEDIGDLMEQAGWSLDGSPKARPFCPRHRGDQA